jgi:hypothetical protein
MNVKELADRVAYVDSELEQNLIEMINSYSLAVRIQDIIQSSISYSCILFSVFCAMPQSLPKTILKRKISFINHTDAVIFAQV